MLALARCQPQRSHGDQNDAPIDGRVFVLSAADWSISLLPHFIFIRAIIPLFNSVWFEIYLHTGMNQSYLFAAPMFAGGEVP